MTALGRVFLSIFFACVVLGPSLASAQQAAPSPERPIVVKEVAVQGSRRVQEAVILGRITTKVGGQFVPARLADDIRAVFSLGFFDDVQLKVEDFEGGVKVTFRVVERPFVRDIQFVGNKKVDTTTLQEKIDLKLGSVYNPVEVNRSAERVKDHYEEEGYFEVAGTPDAQKHPDGDVTVVFRVAEGRKITIEEIVTRRPGGEPKEIKAIMATQGGSSTSSGGPSSDRSWMTTSSGSSRSTTTTAQARVSRRISGGADTGAPSASSSWRGRSSRSAGGRDWQQHPARREIRRRIKLKTDDVFALQAQESMGDPGPHGVVGRARPTNPTATQDAATRRCYRLRDRQVRGLRGADQHLETPGARQDPPARDPMHEGDLFTTKDLERARQKLNNLGYFEQVKATTAPGSAKDKIVVNIEVTEKPTGLFSIGGGYSSQDSFIGTVDLSQRNFLGRGWEVFLKLRAGASTQQGTIGFTEPWLFDRPLSAGFDLFNNRRVLVRSTPGRDIVRPQLGDYSLEPDLPRNEDEIPTCPAASRTC